MSQFSDPSPSEPQYQPHPPGGGGAVDKTSGMAIAALVLGILGFVTGCLGIGVLFALVGLVLGIVAVVNIGKPNKPMHGKGMAIAGICLSGLTLLMMPLLIGIMLPAMGAARRTARQMESNSQLRGVHQSAVIFAQSNGYYLPGLDRDGNVLPDGADTTGNSGDGATPAARYWVLLNGSFIPQQMLGSPQETLTATWNHDPVTPQMYSYALSDIDASTAHADGRRAEWKDNANSRAVMMSDRNTGSGSADTQVQSLWTSAPGDWKGGVVWGDNHVEFSTTHTGLSTDYDQTTNTFDSLFLNEASGPNALMTHQ